MIIYKGQQAGITLLEVLMVLAIIAILATVAVPAFQTLVQNYRLSATSENLFYALQYARSEAIKRNQTVYISFQTGDTWCYGMNTGSACDCSNPSSCNLGTHTYSAAQLLSLSVTNFPTNILQYEGSRGAANSSGTITFTIYGQSKLIRLTVGRLGNLQICSTGLSGYSTCT